MTRGVTLRKMEVDLLVYNGSVFTIKRFRYIPLKLDTRTRYQYRNEDFIQNYR